MKNKPSISENDILFEDNHLIVINKKPSQIVQGDKTGDEPLSEITKQFLIEKYNKPGKAYLGVIHRIDRPVSGVLIFAKTDKALSRMNKKFKNNEIQKIYWAIVKDSPPSITGKLTHYLLKNSRQNKSYAHRESVPKSKEASLTYYLKQNFKKFFLLEIHPHTGRHHQIRAQLSFIGCPVKGDLKYGYPRSNPDASIHLHARCITFEHPVRDESIALIAPPPLPDTLWELALKQEKPVN